MAENSNHVAFSAPWKYPAELPTATNEEGVSEYVWIFDGRRRGLGFYVHGRQRWLWCDLKPVENVRCWCEAQPPELFERVEKAEVKNDG